MKTLNMHDSVQAISKTFANSKRRHRRIGREKIFSMNTFRSHRNGTVGQATHRIDPNARCSRGVWANPFRAEEKKNGTTP